MFKKEKKKLWQPLLAFSGEAGLHHVHHQHCLIVLPLVCHPPHVLTL